MYSQLSQLHLGLALAAAGVLGKDVQDQCGPVDDLDVHDAFQPAQLARGWGTTSTLATSIPGATLSGNAPASTPVHLAVTLQPRNTAAEQAALRAMYQPGSATFHKFLTPSQWKLTYAPTAVEVDTVTSYLVKQGFTGLTVQGDRLLISATGTVGEAEKAFSTTIGSYTMPNGSTFIANVTGAEVPSSLSGIVQGVVGLSNWRLPTPQPVMMTQNAASKAAATQGGGTGRRQERDVGGEPGHPERDPAGGLPEHLRRRGHLDGLQDRGRAVHRGRRQRRDHRPAHRGDRIQTAPVPVTIIKVGPQSTDTSGADEWDLDTQSSSAMATTLKRIYLYNVGALTTPIWTPRSPRSSPRTRRSPCRPASAAATSARTSTAP